MWTENHLYVVSVILFYGHIRLLPFISLWYKLLFRDNIDAFEIQLIFNFFMGWDYLKFAFTLSNDHIDGICWMQSWYCTGWKDHSVDKFKYRSMKFLLDMIIWSHIVVPYKNVFVPMFDNVTFIQFEIILSTLTDYWIEAWHHLSLDNSTLLLFCCGNLSY